MKHKGTPRIGVFDSGIGGLTVVRELLRVMPQGSIVYLGDTARVPYGNKSSTVISRFARQAVRFLEGQQVDIIVIACNTVSALCLESLRRLAVVPVVGVVESGARRALEATRNRSIGVMGTEATVRSGTYERVVRRMNPDVVVHQQSCPLLVPLVEEGWLTHPVTRSVVTHYLQPLLAAGVDTVILGCTHYPLLQPVFRDVAGSDISLIDSAAGVCEEVKAQLEQEKDSAGGASPHHRFWVTDDAARFRRLGGQFVQGVLDSNVGHVRLEE